MLNRDTLRMDELDVYLNGRFVPSSQAAIRLDDVGFALGATVSERLRTFAGQLFRLDDHLARLDRSLQIIGVEPSLTREGFRDVAKEIARRNHPRLPTGSDLDVAILVTPGPMPSWPSGNDPHAESPTPTVCVHSAPLPFRRWAEKYAAGQCLVTTGIEQIPPACWPAELKCRSRMHYYLADRQAQAISPGAAALLLDGAGHVRETSTANVLAYFADDGLVTPPVEAVLPGVSLMMVKELAGRLAIPFTERELNVDDLFAADELLTASTPYCLLPVVRLNDQPISTGKPGPIYQQLLAAWGEAVGVDIQRQARQFG